MDFKGELNETKGINEVDEVGETIDDREFYGEEAWGDFERLMGDDRMEDRSFEKDYPLPTKEEAETELNRMFEGKHVLEAAGQEKLEKDNLHYDDHGNLYRIGNDLSPDNQYEINGYTYKTDGEGRITSAEGTLHMKDREGRLPIRDSLEDIGKGDQREGDDRGHLIGDQFDGSNGLENMVPQDAEINRKDFKDFENELAKQVKDGKEVNTKIEPVYEGESRRPEAMVVTYAIDGEESIRVFPNNQEKKV